MPEPTDRSVWMIDRPRCPRCGSNLLTNGRLVWCSFVGGRGAMPCDYGLDGTVRLDAVPIDGRGGDNHA